MAYVGYYDRTAPLPLPVFSVAIRLAVYRHITLQRLRSYDARRCSYQMPPLARAWIDEYESA